MTGRRPRLTEQVPPRGITARELAHYLGLSESGFSSLRPKLDAAGFPAIDPVLSRYDRRAVDAWLDTRSGLAIRSDIDPDMELDQWDPSECDIS